VNGNVALRGEPGPSWAGTCWDQATKAGVKRLRGVGTAKNSPGDKDSSNGLGRKARLYLPGLLAGVLIIGSLVTLRLLLVSRAAAPVEHGCRFAGPLVPATEQPASEAPTGAKASAPAGASPVPLSSKNAWRFGFGLSESADPEYWAKALGAGWYLDWTARLSPDATEVDHWLMVRVAPGCTRPSMQEAAQLAQQRPGQTWIIGNEPDVIWQDNLPPELYAEAYHAYYAAIKGADPSARLAVAGVAQPTPLRLAYLDRVLQAYQRAYGGPMPVDVWTVHNFVLREERGSWGAEIPPGFEDLTVGKLYEVSDHARLDLFESQLRMFRDWMARRGYRDVPLALTEFGILMPSDYGFPPDVVSGYAERTLDLLMTLEDPATGYAADDNRLVQRWAWFSLSDPNFPAGNLADLHLGHLTEVGLAFRQAAERWSGER
jgi:hypothetical protein